MEHAKQALSVINAANLPYQNTGSVHAGNTRCSSSGSHAVGDLTDAQSTSFLQARGLSPSDAQQIVGLTGGRCIQLVAAAESIHNGESIDGEVLAILPFLLSQGEGEGGGCWGIV